MTFTLPSVLVSDTIEQLMSHLATAEKAKKEAEAEYERLRKELKEIMIAGKVTTQKTVWGTVTLCEGRKSVAYSQAIILREAKLKAAKEIEELKGKAKVTHGEKSIRATWVK
ncbi:hypothetical protein b3_0251 [Synechococcus phage B3]|nr:hypothetical protein b3_0251 [Synechococcus phage B3]QGT54859.1 hypothetical protein b23_0245 [Synechococcus phage B23]